MPNEKMDEIEKRLQDSFDAYMTAVGDLLQKLSYIRTWIPPEVGLASDRVYDTAKAVKDAVNAKSCERGRQTQAGNGYDKN